MTGPSGATGATGSDDVALRRTRIATWVRRGKRVGYLALIVAVVAFAVGLVAGFSTAVVDVVVAGLVVSCVVLPAPIVLGYGIRAAERDERERARGRRPTAGP